MRRSLLIGFLFCFGSAVGQQVFKTTSPSTIAYLEYLPEGYQNNSDKYPIVFFLHGNGEKGVNSTDTTVLKQYINLVTKHGPPKYVKGGTDFPFILISPQLKMGNGSWSSSYVMEVINHCKKYLRVDEQRIYLTGLSLGGGGTWVTAQDYPALFAAIAPVCGGYNSPAKACNLASENLPVWAFHGDKDSVVPLSRSSNMVNAINACTPTPNPLALMTVYPGVGHNAWDYAYRTDHSLHNPNVYEWILNQKNTINHGNAIPNANAGADQSTSSRTLQLTGSGSDKDGSIVSYAWTKLDGPSVSIANTGAPALSLSNLVNGKYLFRLQVTDDEGNTDSDYVTVTANERASVVVNAGADKIIRLPSTSTALTASVADGIAISSYQWSRIAGVSCVMSNTTSSTLKLGGLASGTYTFRVTVYDSNGSTGSDDVTVIVDSPPVANAGPDRQVTLPLTANVTITGGGYDVDGSIVKYLWSKYSGPNISMTNTTSKDVVITRIYEGTYVLKLAVTDNYGVTSFDYVTITAGESATEISLPLVKVNAGPDKLVKLPTTSAAVTGSASVDGATITGYLWSKISGPACTVNNATTSTLKLSGLSSGTYVFRLTARASNGSEGTDDVTVIVDAPPIVNAGVDRFVSLPMQADLSVAGSATDPDGKIIKYLWSKYSGPNASISNTTSSTLMIKLLVEGTYVFKLAVTDDLGATGIDYVTITVTDPLITGLSQTADPEIQEDAFHQATSETFSENTFVVLLTEAGREVYRGKWSADVTRQVLNKNQMYFYRVLEEGKVRTGKIYIRDY